MIGLMILMGQDVQGLWYVYLDMCFHFCSFRWNQKCQNCTSTQSTSFVVVHVISHDVRLTKWLNLWLKVKWNCIYLWSKVHTTSRNGVASTTLSHILLDHITSTQTPHNHHQSITGTIKCVKYVSWPRWVSLLPQGHKLCPYRYMCKVYITHLQLNRRHLNCLIR